MSYRVAQRPRGFTIVEVLVVMGIIAILTALLLPTIAGARAQANRTQCLSNIRQIGLGISIYAHDFGVLPPVEPLPQFAPKKIYPPSFYSERGSGLLAMPPSSGFNRYYLSCPEGWASAGDGDWYQSEGLSPTGSAYMDYAYWGGRYAPADDYDVRYASFKYRAQEKGTKILVTDAVTDQAGAYSQVLSTVGYGNHGTNHSSTLTEVQMTDGRGMQLPGRIVLRSSGSSVLFSDGHAEWFPARKLTQQTLGLAYPPPDQWR